MKVSKLVPLAILLVAISLPAQNAPAATPAAAPVAPSVNDLNMMLAQLDQVSNTSNLDLAKLRVEKWKADSNAKQQFQQQADLLARNMQGTLPGLVAAVRTSPDNLAANFKLYRNVDALYDVLSSLADQAGHYGPSSDYQTLAADSSNLEKVRHALADRMEALAGYKDAQLARASSGPATSKSGTAPKKIVIDDTAPAKKTTTHKKNAATPASTPQ